MTKAPTTGDEPTHRILSIDGGGIKGTLPASFLASLEDDLDRPIGEYFDLIAGTSTGGILAIGLAMGLPARDLLELYVDRGPDIFGQSGGGLSRAINRHWRSIKHCFATKHDAADLELELVRVLRDKRIGDAKTRLLIPAWDPDHRSVYIFKTAHHPRLRTDYKRRAVDAAMATAAAPTYFKRHRTDDDVGLTDGGTWCNNPIALAVVEAITLLGWPRSSLSVLSVGCGEEVYSFSEDPGLSSLVFDLSRLFMDGQSHGAMGMAKLLTGHEYERDAIFRCCPFVPKNFFQLDDTSRIAQLKGMGASAARKERTRLEPIFFATPAVPFEPVYKLEGAKQ